jgi:hypothetical protein
VHEHHLQELRRQMIGDASEAVLINVWLSLHVAPEGQIAGFLVSQDRASNDETDQ